MCIEKDFSTTIAAKMLGIHENTLRLHARNGKIGRFIGGRWRFTSVAIQRWKESPPSPGRPRKMAPDAKCTPPLDEQFDNAVQIDVSGGQMLFLQQMGVRFGSIDTYLRLLIDSERLTQSE